LKSIGVASAAGLTGNLELQGESPDVLNVIGYPESGIQLFRDFYSIDPDTDVIVPDGLRDPALPDQVGNSMENLVGTAPGAAGPNQQAFAELFQDEYGESPGVFTAQSYDSVAILILANAAAGENNGEAIRDQMRRVANGPGDEYGPGEFIEAVEAAANGDDVNYQGASSTTDFDDRGDPASAAYDIWQFGGEEGTEVTDTITFEAEAGGPSADEAPGGTGRTIQVGILLPETGDLGSVGGPMIQAAQLPVQQVNDSDVDLQVDAQVEDTQTNRSASLSGANALVNAGYPAVCGTASSGNNIPTSQEVFIPNGVVGCSPSSTAVTVSFLEDDDFIFRTAPSDLLQGQVMAQVAAERVGASTASTLFVNNDYGQQLSEQFSEAFQEDHDGEIFQQVAFNKGESSYRSVIQQALQQGG
jgi:ABC-type branched-subunit amino acid transport system substrate-binding protein